MLRNMLPKDSHALMQMLQSDLGAARVNRVSLGKGEQACIMRERVIAGVSLWKEIVKRCEQTLGTTLTPSARRE